MMVQPLTDHQQYKAPLFLRGLQGPGSHTLSGEAAEEFTHERRCFCLLGKSGSRPAVTSAGKFWIQRKNMAGDWRTDPTIAWKDSNQVYHIGVKPACKG